MKIGIIGFGNMGEAIAYGIQEKNVGELMVSGPDLKASTFESHSLWRGLRWSTDNHEVVAFADVIILAVKPQVMAAALPALKDFKGKVISIAAGTKRETIQAACPNATVFRAMPNMPCKILKGTTALVGQEQDPSVNAIFESIGATFWLKEENQIDAFTAVAGSGPAFVFSMIEAMANAGVSEGLDPNIAERIALEAVWGSAAYARERIVTTGYRPSLGELKDEITSKGGTTAAGREVFDAGITDLCNKTITAATERARKLGNS